MRLRHEPLDLKTTFEFRIALGARAVHRNTLIAIEHDGIEGIGEAAPSHYYGENRALVEAALATWAPLLGDDPLALDAIAGRMTGALWGHGAARAAIDMALHDWIGKKLGLPVWKLLGLDRARTPVSCVTLGMAGPEEMERKLESVIDFPMIKVKLGGAGDVENLERIRARYTGKLQVDANTAWSPADAVRVLRAIAPLGIELVEQPVPREDLEGLKWVRERSPIPVFADESCHHASDIANLACRCDGVNLKIMKSGGIREMLRTIHAAHAHGMKVMLGSMVETSLALTAAAQLAPLADYLDLDGHWLLAGDPFRGAPGECGVIALSDRPGLGVEPVGARPAVGAAR
ncbi:MAG: dipeptide epimerase [Candidatus Eisenbacteria bacterium]|uniref:Dipeptide epimerase n=1 Tax=Eiseniibacteriota bacterium TaxID=2212470 RepID=A0A9D6LC18_UNCEI|nr:dipeptide epimerase [Candidatus Eisenbacteria bacterium]MBI3539939.1 dipeptide epimerase [Candidatus Eisenbacteria bacterium]